MTPVPFDEKAVFNSARAFALSEERLAYVQVACAASPNAQPRILELLRVYDQEKCFLESPAVVFPASLCEAQPEQLGTAVGPYTLLEQIGEGGMGTVWMAQQHEPVKRVVALKLIRAGLNLKQVLARFEVERQALALMDHPNIAKVFDGGYVGQVDNLSGQAKNLPHDARPFFAMELIRGAPITKYCDEHQLTPRQRLDLFIPVCHAIQHAHQKGVIHRDLKPSNVLVTHYDGKPVPKVIDFGVAKAAGPALTDRTLVTGFGAVIGTLEYMSPEQAGTNQHDIDTRSDIYSLGVLLYELLTGTTPLASMRINDSGVLEALRIIREEEMPTLSNRLATTEVLPTIAANRGLEPAKLKRLVRGELDWLVMKALEKDRNRRYQTANEFATDVQRYLNDEPVQACPPSAGYRLRKFVNRHRGSVLAVTVVLLALVAGIVGTTVGLVQARANAERATEEEGKAKAALAQSEKQLLRAEWLLYGSQINLAQQSWERSNPALAFHYLESCRRDFRGWEHDYLFTLFTSDQQSLRGHTYPVTSVAFCPNGRCIVSGSMDKTVRIWDAATGQNILTLRGSAREAYCVAVSADGQRIVSGHQFGAVVVWDAGTGKEVQTLQSDTTPVLSPISAVALTPDGKRIVSGSWDHTVRVWDAATGKNKLTIRERKEVYSVAVSPDGRRIVSGTMDKTVRVWDSDTGKNTLALQGHESAITGVAFSHDGQRIASASADKTVRVWNAHTGTEALTLRGHTDTVMCVAFTRDGMRLVSGSRNREVKVWDAESGRELQTFRGHDESVASVAVSPDGKHIVSGSFDRTVKVWNAAAGQESLPTWARQPTTCLALSRDGQRVVTGWSNLVKVWDAARGDKPLELKASGIEVNCVAMSPDGQRLASGADKTVMVWDAARDFEPMTITTGHAFQVRCVAVSPDGRRIACVSGDQTVGVWDAATGENTLTLRGHTEGFWDVAFSPDGQRLVSGGQDGTLKVWDAATGEETLSLRGHTSFISSVAFSPDGRHIVSGSSDKSVRVFDAATGQNTLTLRGHTGEIGCVAISPDGRRIASAGFDRAVKLWDAATGYETLTIKSQSTVRSLAFSPDGKRILSVGDSDRTVTIWDASKCQATP